MIVTPYVFISLNEEQVGGVGVVGLTDGTVEMIFSPNVEIQFDDRAAFEKFVHLLGAYAESLAAPEEES